jgi:hypothetical protein
MFLAFAFLYGVQFGWKKRLCMFGDIGTLFYKYRFYDIAEFFYLPPPPPAAVLSEEHFLYLSFLLLRSFCGKKNVADGRTDVLISHLQAGFILVHGCSNTVINRISQPRHTVKRFYHLVDKSSHLSDSMERKHFSIPQPVKFPTVYGTRRSCPVLTRCRHLSMFWARLNHFATYHPSECYTRVLFIRGQLVSERRHCKRGIPAHRK